MKSLNNREVEIQDQSSSSSSKFTTANNTPNTITTMASLMPSGSPITTSMITSRDSRTNLTSSVDSMIQFPLEKANSYQQAQMMDTMYAGSTINHNNNIVLAGGNSSNYGASSSSSKSTGDQPLQLSSGLAVSSVIDPKSYAYSNPKYKTGQNVSLVFIFWRRKKL